MRPPGRSRSTAAASPSSSASSSSLTAMRSAWKTRVAGWIRRRWRGLTGRVRSMRAARSSAVATGRGLAGGHDGLGDPPRGRLLAVLAEQRGELVGGQRRDQLGGRHAPGRVEAHVQRAAGAEPEARGRGRQAGTTTGPGRTGPRPPPRTRHRARPRPAPGSSPGAGPGGRRSGPGGRPTRSIAAPSASRPSTRPSGLAASRIRSVCPPPPTVASICRLPAAGARVSRTSAGITGKCPSCISPPWWLRIPGGPWKRVWCDVRSPGRRWRRRRRTGPPGSARTRPSAPAPRSRRGRESP